MKRQNISKKLKVLEDAPVKNRKYLMISLFPEIVNKYILPY